LVKKVPEGEVSKVEAFPVGFLLVAVAPISAKRPQGERSSNDPAGIEHSDSVTTATRKTMTMTTTFNDNNNSHNN
jgi:hypothetical protein